MEFNFLDFLVSLIITVVIYSLPIIIARYAVLKRPIEKKKALIVTISYAVFGFIIMAALTYWVTGGEGGVTGGGLLLWSFVNYKVLTTGEDKRESVAVPAQIPDGGNFDTVPQNQVIPEARYCKQCGNPVDGETKKCSGCGKQYFRFSWKVFSFALVCVLLVGMTILSISQYTTIMGWEEAYSRRENTIKLLEENVDERDRKILSLRATIIKLKQKADFLDNSITFVVSGNSEVYHTYDCFHFQTADGYWAYNIQAAESKGYRPCRSCH